MTGAGWLFDALGIQVSDGSGGVVPQRKHVQFPGASVTDDPLSGSTVVDLSSVVGAAIPAPALVATSNIASLSGVQVVDGVNTGTADVLLTSQTTPSQNGFWTPNTSGAWTRPSYYNSDATVVAQLGLPFGAVLNGLLGTGSVWGQSAGATIAGTKTFVRLPDAAVKAAKINLPPPVYTGSPYTDTAGQTKVTAMINAALAQAIANPGTTVRLAAGYEYVVNGDLIMDACRSVVLEGGAGPAQVGGTIITRVGASAVNIGWPGCIQPAVNATVTVSIPSTLGVAVGQILSDISFADSPNFYQVTAFVANTSITLKNLGSSTNDVAASTTTSANFTQPAQGASVVGVTLTASGFTTVGAYVNVVGGGTYQVTAIAGTVATLLRLYSTDATTGTTINSGAVVAIAVPASFLRSTEAIVQMRSTYGCAVERLTLKAYNAATFTGRAINGECSVYGSDGALNTVEFCAFINNLFTPTAPALVANLSSAPAVSITGTCGFALDVRIEIIDSTHFRYSVDGGMRWEGASAYRGSTTCAIATTFALPVWSNGYGLTFNFPAGTYTSEHVYTALQGMQRQVHQNEQFGSDVRKCSFFGALHAIAQNGVDNRTLQCITNQIAGYNHVSYGGNDIQVDMQTEGGGNGYGRAGVWHQNTIRPRIKLSSGDQTNAGPLVTLTSCTSPRVDGTMSIAPGGGAAIDLNGSQNTEVHGHYVCDAIVNAVGPATNVAILLFNCQGFTYGLDTNGNVTNTAIVGSSYSYATVFVDGTVTLPYTSVFGKMQHQGAYCNIPFATTVANGTNVDLNSGASTFYLTGATAAFSLDGFGAGSPGQRLKVISAIAQQLMVVHQSGTETVAAAKIRTPNAANRVFPAPPSGGFLELEFLYVPSGVFGTACWVLIGSSVTNQQSGTATLAAGTVSIAATITAASVIVATVKTPANHTLTVDYAVLSADRSVGAPGSFKITAVLAAGTINTADTSTIDWIVVNP